MESESFILWISSEDGLLCQIKVKPFEVEDELRFIVADQADHSAILSMDFELGRLAAEYPNSYWQGIEESIADKIEGRYL